MEHKRAIKRWLWYFSIPAAAILLFKLYDNFGEALGLVGKLIGILAPFVGGFVLAFFMYRPSHWVENALLKCKGKLWPRLARPLALTATYLALVGILVLVMYLLIPTLTYSLISLANALPDYIAAASQTIRQWEENGGWMAAIGLTERLGEVYAHLLETVSRLLTTENILNAIKGVGNVAASIVDVVIAFIVSLYMLAGREHLTASVKNLLSLFFKPRILSAIGRYGYRSIHLFGSYCYGAVIDALCVGIVVSIGLALFRIPYAVLLGMGLGLMNIVPYFGAIIGGAGIALVTLLTTNLYTTIGVLIFVVVVQQIDSNILQPRVVGDSVGLRPIYVLLSVTLFGGLLGFWGILLGPPLMAIVQMFVREATAARLRRAAENENETESETPTDAE